MHGWQYRKRVCHQTAIKYDKGRQRERRAATAKPDIPRHYTSKDDTCQSIEPALAHTSRVGFVHFYQALSGRDLLQVIERDWVQLGMDASPADSADGAVINTIARLAGGNFRLVAPLFAEIQRVIAVNRLRTVTPRLWTAPAKASRSTRTYAASRGD